MNKKPELKIDEDGNKFWHINHQYYHCEDGPAVIYADEDKYWYLNGRSYSYEEWFKRLTPEQQYNYLWKLDE
jgi:hypothetical protein